jgi:signal transduction histidine kinase
MVFQSGRLNEAFSHEQAGPIELYADTRRDIPDPNNLITTFILSAALVLLIGMLLFGTWVTQRSADAVLQHSANAAAMFVDSAIEPLAQDLANQPQLSRASVDAIDALLAHDAIRHKLSGLTIWRPDGVIAYAKSRELIGTFDTLSLGLKAAAAGKVDIELSGVNAGVVTESVPDVEGRSYKIYSPIHQAGSTNVIAVAGYVEPPQQLDTMLSQGRRDTWVVVGVFTILIFGLTFNLIHHASELIKQQNFDLRERYSAQVRLNLQNEMLRKELQDAHMEGIAINENFLRRVGADLHDGPAQFLALALLRLDDINARGGSVGPAPEAEGDARRAKALETVRSATQNALGEIRSISSGLALPEIADRSPEDIIGLAVNAFVAATQTRVACEIALLPERLPLAWSVCLFRFVQEGLSNGYRHAAGKGQEVRGRCVDGCLEVEVVDRGPGFDVVGAFSKTSRLGLLGLRHRVETLGGSFDISSVRGEGTTITLSIPLDDLRDQP